MALIKKIIIAFVLALVAIQIPFIYRRYQMGERSRLIAQMQAERRPSPSLGFDEYKGVVHVHTALGGHSSAGFDELISAANSNGLDFVVMTEHYAEMYDTAALTLNGVYGKTLFIGGNEVDTADTDRFFMIPGGSDAASFRNEPTADVLDKIHSDKGLAMIAYPEKFRSWESNFDGVEVLNLKTEAKSMSLITLPLDLFWSGIAYPDLTFARHLKRNDINLRQFDELSTSRRISLFGGADAHSNIGVHIGGTETGGRLINIKLDPYEKVFRVVRLHLLVPQGQPLTRDALIEALREGRFFTAIDAFGDASGSSFTAWGNKVVQQGGEIPYSAGITLRTTSPVPARTVFFKNGARFAETPDSLEAIAMPDGPGVYRVEVYLDQVNSGDMPWVMTNPIYVR